MGFQKTNLLRKSPSSFPSLRTIFMDQKKCALFWWLSTFYRLFFTFLFGHKPQIIRVLTTISKSFLKPVHIFCSRWGRRRTIWRDDRNPSLVFGPKGGTNLTLWAFGEWASQKKCVWDRQSDPFQTLVDLDKLRRSSGQGGAGKAFFFDGLTFWKECCYKDSTNCLAHFPVELPTDWIELRHSGFLPLSACITRSLRNPQNKQEYFFTDELRFVKDFAMHLTKKHRSLKTQRKPKGRSDHFSGHKLRSLAPQKRPTRLSITRPIWPSLWVFEEISSSEIRFLSFLSLVT